MPHAQRAARCQVQNFDKTPLCCESVRLLLKKSSVGCECDAFYVIRNCQFGGATSRIGGFIHTIRGMSFGSQAGGGFVTQGHRCHWCVATATKNERRGNEFSRLKF